MLLISLMLHAAVLLLVQPRPAAVSDAVTVINARIAPLNRAAIPHTPAPQTPVPPHKPVVEPPRTEPANKPPADEVHSPPARPQPVVVDTTPTAPVRVPDAGQAQTPAPALPLPSVPVMVDTHWYEAKQLDVQPKAASPINPVYPPEAQRRNQQGSVKLRLKIDESGQVQDVEVIEGQPPGVFDQSALDAFKHGRFVPAVKDGRPVRALITIQVRYELDGF